MIARRFLPETVSLLTGVAAWYALESMSPGAGYPGGIYLFMGLSFLGALLSSVIYRLAKRPGMWAHLPMQVASYILISILTYTPPSPDRPPNDLGPFLYLLALIVVAVGMLPAVPVCSVYRSLYAKRFGKFPETSEQGSEKP